MPCRNYHEELKGIYGEATKRLSVKITEKHYDFLDTIIFQDAANNLSDAVMWCIDACMKVEKLYGTDACDIAHHDIRTGANSEQGV